MLSLVRTVLAAPGSAARVFFGPFSSGSQVRRAILYAVSANVSTIAAAVFDDRPADTSAAFATGEPLFGQGSANTIIPTTSGEIIANLSLMFVRKRWLVFQIESVPAQQGRLTVSLDSNQRSVV